MASLTNIASGLELGPNKPFSVPMEDTSTQDVPATLMRSTRLSGSVVAMAFAIPNGVGHRPCTSETTANIQASFIQFGLEGLEGTEKLTF